MFRRDRQYFDYDLLGNPGIPSGYSIPIGPSTAPTGSYAWPQVNAIAVHVQHRAPHDGHQPDTAAAVDGDVPLRIFAEHLPGAEPDPERQSVAGQEVLLQEFQRNSTDDFTAAVDWKPVQGTKLTFEEQIDHYKGDSYFTMAPQFLNVQEADGTKVALLDSYQRFLPYGYSTHGRICCQRQTATPPA